MRRALVPLGLAVLAAAALPARAQDAPKPPAAPPAPEAHKAPGEIVTGIPWQTDFDAAKALAKKEGKSVLVYLTPSWFH